MSEQQQSGRAGQEQAELEDEFGGPAGPLPRAQTPAQDSSFDDLLDQIDAVIEANPEGYVKSFVQRGGQ